MAIQMKATEQYFHVVLFGGSNFWICGWNPAWKSSSVIIQMKALQQ